MGVDTQNGLKSGLLYGKGGEGEIWQRTKLYFWWEILRSLWNSNSRLGWVMPRGVLHLKWSTMIWFEIPFCNLDPKRINLREQGWRNKLGAVFFFSMVLGWVCLICNIYREVLGGGGQSGVLMVGAGWDKMPPLTHWLPPLFSWRAIATTLRWWRWLIVIELEYGRSSKTTTL